jgi:Protein of unknown function (DUF1566)/Carboxypeptidase regulatory-like domain
MRHLKFFFVMVCAGLLGSCGGGTNGSGGNFNVDPLPTDSVSGTVTLKGAPLSGVKVTAFLTNSNVIYSTTTTDANGNYSFTGLETSGNVAGEYQFWATKPGYGFYPSAGSAGKATRFDYTGQFVGNGVTDIAIYFTVIDYVALPNNSLAGGNFTAYDGSNPLVTLARTGQTVSYANGDDASQSKGVAWPAIRFTDNEDGTVTDHLTGLIWLKNAGCFPPATWSSAVTEVTRLADGACGLSDGSTAGKWRLANLNELESLIDVSASDPALSIGSPFDNVSNGIYWTSTSYFGGEAGSPQAWTIRLSDGRYMNDSSSNVKATANNAVWAVKGTSAGTVQLQATGMYVPYLPGDDGSLQTGVRLTYPRWVDNGNGTITDTVTGLVWLKRADCIRQTWSDAIAAVNALANGQCGLSDGSSAGQWRMPNRQEMLSLSDRMETNHADFFNQSYTWKASQTVYQAPIFGTFVPSEYYWTSTTNAADTSEAWTIFSCDFGVYDISKAQTGYTLAVR